MFFGYMLYLFSTLLEVFFCFAPNRLRPLTTTATTILFYEPPYHSKKTDDGQTSAHACCAYKNDAEKKPDLITCVQLRIWNGTDGRKDCNRGNGKPKPPPLCVCPSVCLGALRAALARIPPSSRDLILSPFTYGMLARNLPVIVGSKTMMMMMKKRYVTHSAFRFSIPSHTS